jgi:hypothetical protein
MPKRMKRHARSARLRDYYRPTLIPGLLLHPAVLLLNLIVRTAEDNGKTDGRIPAETVDVVTALIRNTYDFPDLDLAQGKGVAINFVGQFLHPDDYEQMEQLMDDIAGRGKEASGRRCAPCARPSIARRRHWANDPSARVRKALSRRCRPSGSGAGCGYTTRRQSPGRWQR